MAPTRTRNSESSGSRPTKKLKRSNPSTESSHTPGVQKLKGSLRQTRRLLAKDNLSPDVRVETERRLKALEADLAQAEVSRKEKSIAVRYHRVKFFERQKVARKIKQTKKKLSSAESESQRATLEAELLELRVDLNYILHYPKTKKYISLFPPETRAKDADVGDQVESTNTDTASERDEVRLWVRNLMSAGELPTEPEVNLDHRDQTKSAKWDKEKPSTKKKPSARDEGAGLDEDEFFGNDNGSDEDDS